MGQAVGRLPACLPVNFPLVVFYFVIFHFVAGSAFKEDTARTASCVIIWLCCARSFHAVVIIASSCGHIMLTFCWQAA